MNICKKCGKRNTTENRVEWWRGEGPYHYGCRKPKFRRLRVYLPVPKVEKPKSEPIKYKTYRRGFLYLVQGIKLRCAVKTWRFWELKHILKAFCTVVANELAKGNEVNLMGFGTFSQRLNERGGVKIEFKAGRVLQQMVEGGWEGRRVKWPTIKRNKRV